MFQPSDSPGFQLLSAVQFPLARQPASQPFLLIRYIVMRNHQIPMLPHVCRSQIIHVLPALLKWSPADSQRLKLFYLQSSQLIILVGAALGVEPPGQVNPVRAEQIGRNRKRAMFPVIAVKLLISPIPGSGSKIPVRLQNRPAVPRNIHIELRYLQVVKQFCYRCLKSSVPEILQFNRKHTPGYPRQAGLSQPD